MKVGIDLEKVHEDEHVLQLRVAVSDGVSEFANQVYADPSDLAKAVEDLGALKGQAPGATIDVQFGKFGPELGGGAFHARFRLLPPGLLYVTSRQESDYTDFGDESVASTATMHLRSEPGLLDRFVAELRNLAAKACDAARLDGIDGP